MRLLKGCIYSFRAPPHRRTTAVRRTTQNHPLRYVPTVPVGSTPVVNPQGHMGLPHGAASQGHGIYGIFLTPFSFLTPFLFSCQTSPVSQSQYGCHRYSHIHLINTRLLITRGSRWGHGCCETARYCLGPGLEVCALIDSTSNLLQIAYRIESYSIYYWLRHV